MSRLKFRLQKILLGLTLAATAGTVMAADAPKPDFSGVWLPIAKDSGRWPSQLPLTPAATAARQRWNEAYNPIDVTRDDEYLSCTPYKLPQIISAITQYPFEVVQTPQLLLIHAEVYGQIRRVYMNGAPAGDRLPTHTGYSLGHWEGAQLVVETTHILPQHEGSRFPTSPAMRIVERFSLQGSGQSRLLIDEVTVTDPVMYKEPFSFRMIYKTVAGVEVGEYICEQDIWDQHRDGNASRIPWR